MEGQGQGQGQGLPSAADRLGRERGREEERFWFPHASCGSWGIGEDIDFQKPSWPDGLTCLCLKYVQRSGAVVGEKRRHAHSSISVAVVVECQTTVP